MDDPRLETPVETDGEFSPYAPVPVEAPPQPVEPAEDIRDGRVQANAGGETDGRKGHRTEELAAGRHVSSPGFATRGS